MKQAYLVKIQVEFSAAHHIRGYDGECARPHGHNFKVEVEAQCDFLNEIGIAVDFKELKKITKNLIDRYDHQDLNTLFPFNEINPTAETLSSFFYHEINQTIQKNKDLKSLVLRKVSIWENDRSCASFGIV